MSRDLSPRDEYTLARRRARLQSGCIEDDYFSDEDNGRPPLKPPRVSQGAGSPSWAGQTEVARLTPPIPEPGRGYSPAAQISPKYSPSYPSHSPVYGGHSPKPSSPATFTQAVPKPMYKVSSPNRHYPEVASVARVTKSRDRDGFDVHL
eukprot:TRINITY_DN56967_c0_g1_i1.p1 TRINITY_DN56967_c0_g1~~TRINITY_DN56967_c0_g1_i1.p1  ORF type:complete len:149 (+),score=9.68 TRINITY_DN56967_c0_g1_i1:44-490(+)